LSEHIQEEWRTTLQEYVVYGLLFKAIMKDSQVIQSCNSKLRYKQFLEKISMIAEKQHHHFRATLGKMGVKVLRAETRGHHYWVEVKARGYLEEAIYSAEWLRSECEVRLEQLLST